VIHRPIIHPPVIHPPVIHPPIHGHSYRRYHSGSSGVGFHSPGFGFHIRF
jgi:hypothetical protein